MVWVGACTGAVVRVLLEVESYPARVVAQMLKRRAMAKGALLVNVLGR